MDESMEEETFVESDVDQTESTSVAEVLQELEKAWLNEKNAPELLQHMSDNVECLIQQIVSMENNLHRLHRDDLRLGIHKMEIDRIRFLISSYLRTRLEKIELYAIDIIQEEAKRSEHERYLTDAELRFAKDWTLNMETLFRTLVVQHLPGTFQKLEVDKMIVKPNVSSHVFIRTNINIEGIIIPGAKDEELDMPKGSQHIIQYNAVAHLVKDGSVQLI